MRFDESVSLSDFKDRVLVVCPRCSACARLDWLSARDERRGDRIVRMAGYRLVCPSCVHVADWRKRFQHECPPTLGLGPELAGFELEVWLQRPCCGETLWAYNAKHLSFLAEYVGAELRERWPDTNEGWQPLGGPGRRLPRWMLSAKNRQAVLAGVKALRRLLL